MIDLILWITGKKPISVRALGSNIIVATPNKSIMILQSYF